MKEEKKTGFSVASMVLGIIGICLSFIPIVNNVSFILGVLSVIFAIVSLVKKSGKAKAIVGLILGILSVVITLSLQNSLSKSLDDVGKDLDNMTGDNTEEILKKLESDGINIVYVTLHVGLGTFRPVKVDDVTKHQMHSEYFVIDEKACDIINNTKKQGGRVIAVGTTSCRVLESATDDNGIIHPMAKDTNIFIYPGYKFKMLDALITNFHLPESTLIMLVSALAGKEHIMQAYEKAVEEEYRFFSFGDCMFIS